MKKYPYTESTDMVVYDIPKKKEKKQRPFLVGLTSALLASVFTFVACGAGGYYLVKHNGINPNSLLTSKVTATADNKSDIATPTVNTNVSKGALTVTEIAQKVGPSVVGVINKTTVSAQKYYDPFSGRYYYTEDPSNDGQTVEQGSGSGIIISKDGYIVTNQHVVDGASEVSVILNTGEEYTAKLVGQDTKTDLAVLKIDAGNDLPAATLGVSADVKVGELAVAIGNPMGMEFSGSVTAGIISAVNRTMTIENRTYNLIQTDAAINSGNSGGALINQYGEIIGINSVKLSSAGVEGMGFAISIDEAKPIIDDLMSSGYVTGRPLVGISIQPTQFGLFVAGVQEGSGAEKAGLQVKDQILAVDGKEVSSTDEINKIRDTKKPGDTLKFKISRNGQTMEVDVVLQEDTSAKEQDKAASQR
ncbi:MAG: trypsin-like peptidase domain-containing protein [Clostridia bacterium]|nr:trypsin-like peptidase domain-containing protein [Clostridia bacterium]